MSTPTTPTSNPFEQAVFQIQTHRLMNPYYTGPGSIDNNTSENTTVGNSVRIESRPALEKALWLASKSIRTPSNVIFQLHNSICLYFNYLYLLQKTLCIYSYLYYTAFVIFIMKFFSLLNLHLLFTLIILLNK